MFTRAIVRKPGMNFSQGLTSFEGPPADFELALEQHEAYCAALERCGLEIARLEADLEHPDSTFVEDVAVLAHGRAMLTRPGAKSRAGEVAGIRDSIRKFFSVVEEIVAPGTLDGGDVCEAGNHFFIGISRRTNVEGAKQLVGFLLKAGCTSSFVDIRAMRSILHLKSGIACVGERQLVVIEEMAALEEFRGFELIRVAHEESYAANCVRVNGRVLIAAGFPALAAELSRRKIKFIPLEVSEFRKMDGGLSCLSLRF